MIPVILLALIGAAALLAGMLWMIVRSRNMQYWIGSYWKSRAQRRSFAAVPNITVYVCMGDHYEPFGGGASHDKAMSRVARWAKEYPEIAQRHRDSLGRVPQHSFFYPIEEYHSDALAPIADLCKAGYGDVEIHYHHDNDTAEGLEQALRGFAHTLHERHGLLRRNASGELEYCFIHGNWALDNSRPDGRWCGVNNELSVLVRTGCRVDYSMPSAPDSTQTQKINSIYFARGQEGKCKAHNDGRDLKVGMWGDPDELLLVQGPLGLNWRSRKFGVIPRIENGEISADAKPTLDRIRLWLKLAPRIEGAPEHVFLKLHTHGATDAATPALLGGDLERMWSFLESEVRDRPGYTLRYVTAWEMYQVIKDLAHGKQPAFHGSSPQDMAAA